MQRKCSCGGTPGPTGECAECRTKRLQRRSAGQTGLTTAPSVVHDVLRSPGRPLDAATRAFFEPRFGHDFGRVRVHADARAAESAQAVNALAYTVGNQVVFASGRYAPGTADGRRLLAHELTHTIQQMGASTPLRRIQRATAEETGLSPSLEEEDESGTDEVNSPASALDITVPAETEVEENDDAGTGAENCGRGSPAVYRGKQVFEGVMPPLPGLTPGVFNPAREAIDNEDTELGKHLAVLNGSRTFAETARMATQINGVERGSMDGVIIEDDGRRKRAYFDPRTQPALNTAESYIVLPPKPYEWVYRDAPANKVLDYITARPAEIMDESRGTVEECRNRTAPVGFFLSGGGLESIVPRHEDIHAADWRKVFCHVLGRRDARVARRTGRENARTGFALNDPAKAEQRAIKKLFRGIQSKEKVAQQFISRVEWRQDRLHARARLNIELARIVIGSGCSGVVATGQVTGGKLL